MARAKKIEDEPKPKTTRPRKKKLPDSGGALTASEATKTAEPLPDSGEPLPPTPETLPATTEPLTTSDPGSGGALVIRGETISHADLGVFQGELWDLHKSGLIRKMLDGNMVVADSGKPLMPKIKRETKSPTSVTTNKELIQMALAKADLDKDFPRGETLSASGLFQWLAWQYLGSPETWPPPKRKSS
jgi:hypothetical protein